MSRYTLNGVKMSSFVVLSDDVTVAVGGTMPMAAFAESVMKVYDAEIDAAAVDVAKRITDDGAPAEVRSATLSLPMPVAHFAFKTYEEQHDYVFDRFVERFNAAVNDDTRMKYGIDVTFVDCKVADSIEREYQPTTITVKHFKYIYETDDNTAMRNIEAFLKSPAFERRREYVAALQLDSYDNAVSAEKIKSKMNADRDQCERRVRDDLGDILRDKRARVVVDFEVEDVTMSYSDGMRVPRKQSLVTYRVEPESE